MWGTDNAQMWGIDNAQMWGTDNAQMWGTYNAQMWGTDNAQMWGTYKRCPYKISLYPSGKKLLKKPYFSERFIVLHV